MEEDRLARVAERDERIKNGTTIELFGVNDWNSEESYQYVNEGLVVSTDLVSCLKMIINRLEKLECQR